VQHIGFTRSFHLSLSRSLLCEAQGHSLDRVEMRDSVRGSAIGLFLQIQIGMAAGLPIRSALAHNRSAKDCPSVYPSRGRRVDPFLRCNRGHVGTL